ncbi:glucokinase [Octadecabacter ascidiaceicola]|uniref:Glucokinase n=1 Tax=Octadecabacter ascidiaceicola TaxID=1655543 RepID=A0A238JMF1_9RHOB|nr:ROK family protein [Octadecabacter ascidiaceicola]SMX31384.1 Glucokinase [Octadecabacter ascidiaceicola]
MTNPAKTLSLVADIGGTNTRCALANGCHVLPKTIRKYSNAQYTGLADVLRGYLADEGNMVPQAACVAVAGPVHDGVATMTNLDWTIDRDTLMAATKAQTVAILNDLQAQGHALGHLNVGSIQSIVEGPAAPPNAVRLIVGVGTGFNAVSVFETENGRFVPPSESGHASLPTRTEQEFRLGRFVSSSQDFPAVEDVLSGRGLERVYAFLSEETGTPAKKPAQDIMSACKTGEDECARDAVNLFVRTLGAVCGDLSLTHLPFGGIYLVGGVSRAMAPYLSEFGFVEAFQDKGRFAPFMTKFSISLIEDDFAALAGAASHIKHLNDI